MGKKVSTKWLTGLLVIVFILIGKSSKALIPEYKFRFLTTNEGLPQNTVDCMLKDRRGFMWFGTWNGMCRYDGYSFKIYQRETHQGELPDNFIRALCEDCEGNIWVGTGKGLSRFVFSEDRFFIPKQIAACFTSYSINHLAFDRHNRLWVATEGYGVWLVQLQANDTGIQRIDNRFLPDRHANYVCLFEKWAFVGTDGGLTVLDPESLDPVPVFDELIRSVEGTIVNCVFADSDRNIWVGTETGLFQYDPVARRVRFYDAQPDHPEALKHLTVNSIAEDSEGNLIVGTLGGLSFFNRKNRTFSSPGGTFARNENLNNPFVNSLLTDDRGNVWVGTDKGGVNYYNIYQKPFCSLVHDPANTNSISHNTINSVLKEKNALWVGTAGGGLNRVTQNGRRVEHFFLESEQQGPAGSNFISCIFRNSRNQLWVGTWGGGLSRLKSVNTRDFQIFLHNDADSASICSDFVSSIAETDKDRLLIGTLDGLDLFSEAGQTFRHVHAKMKLGEPLEVGCVLTDLQKMVWIGTRNGLYRFETAQLDQLDQHDEIVYDVFFNYPGDSLSLPGNYVISLHESRDGTLWIGTYGNGICRYAGDARFIHYNEQDGLCNNVAYAIEEDLQGNLWISTDKGLSKFNPATGKFRNFYVKDGLLSDQFYWTASDADGDGNLYFGGVGGLNYFNAREIGSSGESNKPVFTEFSVFNNPVKIGQKYHHRIILQKSVAETQELELSWKDAVFSVEFSALDYFLPEKIKYRYRMEGVDQDWVEVPSTRRFANYTSLPGGEYIFRVKASNSDGVWSDETAELKIIVQPPFWKTIWFQVAFVAFLLLMVLAYIRYRTSYLKKQKRRLEQQVRERTEKIEEQKEKLLQQAEHLQVTNEELAERQTLIEGQKVELELQNAKIAQQRDELIELNKKVNLVNQLRLRFFTNISHEFRTPLTLIIDPIEQLVRNFKGDRDMMNTLKTINRNAQRLMHLINQLIYFRRIEAGKMTIRAGKGDLKQFLSQIYESFRDLAQHQQITYSFESDPLPGETWFDAEKLENIFFNLLSNAFKNTPVGGKITMRVRFPGISGDHELPCACIEVIDNGSGISEEHLPYIFERFYQAGSVKGAGSGGSGIGLALTLELVQALHGRIEVESKKGEGSCFRIFLPYTREAFGEKEIDQALLPVEVNLEGRLDELVQSLDFAGTDDEPEETAGKQKSRPLILIVEDNFDLRSFLVKTLKTDYRVLGAENGKEGFTMAKKYSPDLILSDVMMPVMDGIELCSRLKKEIQTSHIPVILLTAKSTVEDWIEGLETGADDYIPKPFNLDVLQARMANLIENRRKLKKMFSTSAELTVADLTTNPADEEFLGKAYRILEKNYMHDDFSANQFAAEMFVSRSLLYKKVKAMTDLNITDFVNTYKLRKAVELMQQTKQPISDIAFLTGFNDPKYFSRIFRKFYGMSPSEFQSKK